MVTSRPVLELQLQVLPVAERAVVPPGVELLVEVLLLLVLLEVVLQ